MELTLSDNFLQWCETPLLVILKGELSFVKKHEIQMVTINARLTKRMERSYFNAWLRSLKLTPSSQCFALPNLTIMNYTRYKL